jgi:hypothetical protein
MGISWCVCPVCVRVCTFMSLICTFYWICAHVCGQFRLCYILSIKCQTETYGVASLHISLGNIWNSINLSCIYSECKMCLSNSFHLQLGVYLLKMSTWKVFLFPLVFVCFIHFFSLFLPFFLIFNFVFWLLYHYYYFSYKTTYVYGTCMSSINKISLIVCLYIEYVSPRWLFGTYCIQVGINFSFRT